MKLNITFSGVLIAAVLVVGVGMAVRQFVGGSGDGAQQLATSKVPKLSAEAQAGRVAFDANCAQCHGTNGGGSDKGPPLMHDIYNPGHHPDQSFRYAARNGVQSHHWNFGNMPPQPQVSDEQLTQIVRYVRELQQANGIVFKPHRM